MPFQIEKRQVSRSGELPSFLQQLNGWGVRQSTVRTHVWCLMRDGVVVAECRSRSIAQALAEKLNQTADMGLTS